MIRIVYMVLKTMLIFLTVLGTGSTRVTAEWNGCTCDFIVNAQKG